MQQYRIDKTVVSKSSFKEADDNVTYFKNKTPLERLNHACFIIHQIFNSSPKAKLNRQITTVRKNAK